MAGRKPVPKVVKLVTGKRGRVPVNQKEPKAQAGIPDAPAWLSGRARNAWPHIAKLLLDMGVMTISDALALEALCEAYADLLAARESLNKPVKCGDVEVAAAGSLTYVTIGKNGPMIRTRPETALIADAERRLKSSLSEFGLTPASRSRIKVGDGKETPREEEDFFT